MCLRQALRTDAAGNYYYSVILWSDIKKSIKSTLAAAVILWKAFQVDWGQFFVIANDLKQADSRVFYYIRRSIELNPYLNEQVKITNYRINFPNKTYIEAIPIDPSGEAGSNADIIVFSELWGAHQKAQQKMWCLDDQTEVLTFDGWKKGVDLTTNDSVAVYEESGFVKWEKPRYVFCEEYNGEMHDYSHIHFSLVCTPDHRLFGDYSYSGIKNHKYAKHGVLRSNELRASGNSYYHPRETVAGVEETFVPEPIRLTATKFKPEIKIEWDDWCAFMGLYLSEGSTTRFRNVPCKVRISQLIGPHPDKYWAIHDILVRCFGDWVLIHKRDGFAIASTSLAALTAPLGTTFEKRVPREIMNGPKSGLRRFLDAFVLGDGEIRKNGSVLISIGSRQLADDLHEVAFRLGIKASLRPHGKYWRIHLPAKVRNGGVSASVHRKHWKTIRYSGKVWCPSVSTGLFIARRNGHIFVTGNTEMTLSPTKFGKSFRWIETYAGYTNESPLLEQLYETGVNNGHRFKWAEQFNPPLAVYENEAARMFTLWNGEPRLSWQSAEYYSAEEAVLQPSEFRRVHRNEWGSSAQSFVHFEWLKACEQPIPPLKKNQNVIIAIDAAISGDCFGMAMVSGSDIEDELDVRYARRWIPPKGGKLDFRRGNAAEGDPDDGPEAELRRLLNEYNVVEVAYDPYQLEDLAMRMSSELLAVFYAFNQTGERAVADKSLYDRIRGRRVHYYNQPELEEHIANANAKTEGEKMRLIKKSENAKIDLAVCLSMACDRATYWGI